MYLFFGYRYHILISDRFFRWHLRIPLATIKSNKTWVFIQHDSIPRPMSHPSTLPIFKPPRTPCPLAWNASRLAFFWVQGRALVKHQFLVANIPTATAIGVIYDTPWLALQQQQPTFSTILHYLHLCRYGDIWYCICTSKYLLPNGT